MSWLACFAPGFLDHGCQHALRRRFLHRSWEDSPCLECESVVRAIRIFLLRPRPTCIKVGVSISHRQIRKLAPSLLRRATFGATQSHLVRSGKGADECSLTFTSCVTHDAFYARERFGHLLLVLEWASPAFHGNFRSKIFRDHLKSGSSHGRRSLPAAW